MHLRIKLKKLHSSTIENKAGYGSRWGRGKHSNSILHDDEGVGMTMMREIQHRMTAFTRVETPPIHHTHLKRSIVLFFKYYPRFHSPFQYGNCCCTQIRSSALTCNRSLMLHEQSRVYIAFCSSFLQSERISAQFHYDGDSRLFFLSFLF